jgi:hypothetical protein
MSLRWQVARLLAAAVLASSGVDASEGVIEINQLRAIEGGVTPGDLPGFPVTLAARGSYVLTGNLFDPFPNASAIEITADDVTVDLNGFALVGATECTGDGPTITCTPAGSGVGIFAFEREGIVVRNGSVTGFPGGGVLLFRAEGCRIADLTVAANGSNGIQLGGTCEISGTIVDRSGGVGIFVITDDNTPEDSPTDDIVVRDSVVARNRGEGVFTTSSAGRDRFVMLRSTVSGNGRTGLDLRTEGDVRQCAISGNTGGGIHLGVNSDQADSGLVRGNSVRSNAYGFRFDPAHVGYTHNNFSNAGESSGGVQIGPNVCDGDKTCP